MALPSIWHSPSAACWWMEPPDPRLAIAIVERHEDAIHVTNAYEVLPPAFIATLAQIAGWLAAGTC